MLNRRRAIVVATVALLLFSGACSGGNNDQTPSPTASPASARPSRSPSPTPSPSAAPEPRGLPVRDLVDLARRYRGYEGPAVGRTGPLNHQPGDSVVFSLTDLDAVSEYEVTATVRAVTEHAYFFVQDDEPYSEANLADVAADFESLVWPTITGAFGQPRTPGVDADLRITILHADLRGTGGYVSSSDSVPKGVYAGSNEREMMYIEAGALSTPGAPYNALAAHELQHLILQNYDDGEESWLNEGLSQVAWEMAGGGTDAVWEYLGRPDTQLNVWPTTGTSVHYAGSELFASYLLDHYGGREGANDLTSILEDGLEGVDRFLQTHGTTLDAVYADFVAANVLDLPEGPYGHPNFDGRTEAIEEVAPGDSGEEDVAQFGADYFRAEAGATFNFDGASQVTNGIDAIDGPYWWSDRGDGVNTMLMREVDLTGVTTATLEFDAWFAIEEGWDYAYVAVSDDGGRTWDALAGKQTTDHDPIDVAFGPGYTGDSGGWVREGTDLTPFAGREILLRFEYVTDDATSDVGFGVDNVRIDAIGLLDTGDSTEGWQASGFRRVTGAFAQTFSVQVIYDDGTVERPMLGVGNTASLTLTRAATIAVSGTTTKTTERAGYSWRLD